MMDRTWRTQAACRGHSLEAFFSNDGSGHDPEAVALCGACPVRSSCLAEALELRDTYGYRAGMTGEERKKLLPKASRHPNVDRAPEIVALSSWTAEAVSVALGMHIDVVRRVLKAHREQGTAA